MRIAHGLSATEQRNSRLYIYEILQQTSTYDLYLRPIHERFLFLCR